MHVWAQKIENLINLGIIFIGAHLILAKPRLQINVYGNHNSGLISSKNNQSIVELIFFYYKLNHNQWIDQFSVKLTDTTAEVFLLERIPLFNWYDGKRLRIVDHGGKVIGEGFLSICPTVVQPFHLDSEVSAVITKLNTRDQVKKMLSLKQGIWKIELKSGSLIYTDRLNQISKILRFLEGSKVFEFFHPTKLCVRPK